MAYESVEDANQQTLETLTELERRARELVNILKGGIDVGQSGSLGDLALLDTLSASPVGNAATLRSNIGLGTAATTNVGTGSASVPNTSQADARYARLSGANNFDTAPSVAGDLITTRKETFADPGKSWVDVTSSRLEGVQYTNSLPGPIEVIVEGATTTESLSAPGFYVVVMIVIIDGVSSSIQGLGKNLYYRYPVTFLVPSGSTYEVRIQGGNGSVGKWTELR